MTILSLVIVHLVVRKLPIIILKERSKCRSELSSICKRSRIFASMLKGKRLTMAAPYSVKFQRTQSVRRAYLCATRRQVLIKARTKARQTGTCHHSKAITSLIHRHLGRLKGSKAIQKTKTTAQGTLRTKSEHFTRPRLKKHQNNQTITAVTTCTVLSVSERRTAGRRSCTGVS